MTTYVIILLTLCVLLLLISIGYIIQKRRYFSQKIKPFIDNGATITWYSVPRENPFSYEQLNTLKIINVKDGWAKCVLNDTLMRIYSFGEIREKCVMHGFDCNVIPPIKKQEDETDTISISPDTDTCKRYGLPETLGSAISSYGESELHSTLVTVPYEMIEAINAYAQLITARNSWWKVLNYSPSWNGYDKNYFVAVYNNEIVGNESSSSNHAFAFPSKEIRDAFMENFKEELETAKKLIQ